jgi:hypothetical protein
MKSIAAAEVRRVAEAGGRAASVLENGRLRVLVDDEGGMIPELSARRGDGYLNAHWIPPFRSNSGKRFSETEHGAFWKAKLLYSIAGNFPCSPNFGPGGESDGVLHPPHGWTATLDWKFEASGINPETGAAWALSSLRSPDRNLPLRYRKIDAVLPGIPIHYTSLEISNPGTSDAQINAGWHNTVGSPFLQAGCRLSVSAERFATPPEGGEFDLTGRLAIGAEFGSLAKAPLRSGKTCDLRTVPGMIGFTDLITGPVPRKTPLGWTAVANPALALVYVCCFPGPEAAGDDGIALSFNDIWMQYGGRPFTPWAAYEGGTDRTFCLGTENATGAYANGLAFAKRQKELLGAPTTVTVPAGAKRTLCYGTLFAPYEGGALDGGVLSVEPEKGRLALAGAAKTVKVPADADFSALKVLEKRLP